MNRLIENPARASGFRQFDVHGQEIDADDPKAIQHIVQGGRHRARRRDLSPVLSEFANGRCDLIIFGDVESDRLI